MTPGKVEAVVATSPFATLLGGAMPSVGEAIGALDGVDAHRVGVVGTSVGGYLALRHGTALPRLRAVVDIAGPYDLRAFDELQITRDGPTVRLEPDGNHSCNNLATVVRPVVADWVTDLLGSSDD